MKQNPYLSEDLYLGQGLGQKGQAVLRSRARLAYLFSSRDFLLLINRISTIGGNGVIHRKCFCLWKYQRVWQHAVFPVRKEFTAMFRYFYRPQDVEQVWKTIHQKGCAKLPHMLSVHKDIQVRHNRSFFSVLWSRSCQLLMTATLFV